MEKSSLRYDKKYWPDCSHRLNKLWKTRKDEASVFVASALITENPTTWLQLGKTVYLETPLWEVGCDTITIVRELCSVIKEASRMDYDKVVSAEQMDDVADQIEGLEKVEAAIREAKSHLTYLLEDFRERELEKL